MHMLDLLDKDAWFRLETRIHEQTGLSAAVYDHEGLSVTGRREFCNRLCPAIREHDKARSGVCSVAHQNMALAASQGISVVDECDGGLVKICVPVMHQGRMIGVVGGCGLLLDDGEVETFGLSMLSDIPEQVLEDLASDIPVITRKEADAKVRIIQELLPQALA